MVSNGDVILEPQKRAGYLGNRYWLDGKYDRLIPYK